jgi:hypothetical protein
MLRSMRGFSAQVSASAGESPHGWLDGCVPRELLTAKSRELSVGSWSLLGMLAAFS